MGIMVIGRYFTWAHFGKPEGMLRPGDKPTEKEDGVDFTILDVSDYEPPRAPSKTWRELIKKVWEIDPLTCPLMHFLASKHTQACHMIS